MKAAPAVEPLEAVADGKSLFAFVPLAASGRGDNRGQVP
jgi:hypothetical protein